MSAARHFFEDGAFPGDLETDIQDDNASAHGARRDCERHGQTEMAQQMGRAKDECLDELTDLKGGTWRPKHT
ncbi:hypothetical protein ACH4FX_12210 [Streptomyces sp. NPDC018019]|uniref:hypothetical protein n=1 Tax=Streptomyces sp. NPDC018019 TaxID=3365030 RepID=UPI00378782BD